MKAVLPNLRFSVLAVGVLLSYRIVADEVSYTYDDLDRLIRAEYSDGAVIEYTYDASGNRIGHTVKPANIAPIANPGANRTVRLNSPVALNGGASADPDNGPSPLSYSWTQTAGANIPLNGTTASILRFTPTQVGTYAFDLVVGDGTASSPPAHITVAVPLPGDIDLDGDVDNNDVNLIGAARNKPATDVNDLRDLDANSIINALDARKAVTLCTRPRCATS